MQLSAWAFILATATGIAALAGEAIEAARAYARYRSVKAECEADVARMIARQVIDHHHAPPPPPPPPTTMAN